MENSSVRVLLLLAWTCMALAATKFNIVHTTDIHGWVNGHPHNETLNADLGDFHSLILHMKANAAKNKEEFLLFDTGDLIEGTGLSDATPIHGQYIFDIIQNVSNYDALTMGNHDIGHPDVVSLMGTGFIPFWNGRYLTANSELLNEDYIGQPFAVFTTPLGNTILVLGYLYNFTHEANNTVVVPVSVSLTEDYFKKAMAVPNVDLIVVCAHIAPQFGPELQQIYTAVRAVHKTTPFILLSGHSHEMDFTQFDKNSFTLESGKYFEVIGLIQFNLNNGNIDNLYTDWVETAVENFYSLSNTTYSDFETPQGLQTKAMIQKYASLLGLDIVYGCAPITYSAEAYWSESDSLYKLLVSDIIPQIVFTTSSKNTQFFLTNTATLRYDLFQGPVTRNDIYTISPFNDTYSCFESIPGTSLSSLMAAIKNTSGLNSERCPTFGWKYGLPPWYTSTLEIDTSKVYDLIAATYDADTILPTVQKMFPNEPYSEYKEYDTEYNGTGALQAYVEKTWPCK